MLECHYATKFNHSGHFFFAVAGNGARLQCHAMVNLGGTPAAVKPLTAAVNEY
jgi:hypothetical protein